MSETGGPVYEGSSAWPEKAKSGVVDHVKKSIYEAFSETRHKGEFVEKKWMDSYQRVVDALDDGNRKKIAESLRPVAIGVAKVQKLGAGVADFVLRWGGAFQTVFGAIDVINPSFSIRLGKEGVAQAEKTGKAVSKYVRDMAGRTLKETRVFGVKEATKGVIKNQVGKVSGVQYASGFMADIVGSGGEKVAQISNKIFRGKPKAEAMHA